MTVLGPGRRIGLWVQGCSIGCRGCVSRDTWDPDPVTTMPVSEVLSWCRRSAPNPDGVTISGGEPFEQPEGLRALLEGFASWRREAGLDFDVLCYSGYPLKMLRAKHAALLDLIDAIIPEPYVEGKPIVHVWRGSSNQPLVPLSARGLTRYASFIDRAATVEGKRMQAAIEGGRIWLIGIPARGDMARLEELCADRGLSLEQVSWRR